MNILDPKIGGDQGIDILDNQQPEATFCRDGEHYFVLYTEKEMKTLHPHPTTKISTSVKFDENTYTLGICGSGIDGVGDWDDKNPISLVKENGVWTTSIKKKEGSEEIRFKYVLIDEKNHTLLWEKQSDRKLGDLRTPEF